MTIQDLKGMTCHDKTKACHGCPDRVAEPRCHMTCEGYKARQAAMEQMKRRGRRQSRRAKDKKYT